VNPVSQVFHDETVFDTFFSPTKIFVNLSNDPVSVSFKSNNALYIHHFDVNIAHEYAVFNFCVNHTNLLI